MKTLPDLRPTLGGIHWAVVGGVATRAYMPERATQDLHILFHPQDSQQAIQQMVKAGIQIVSELAIPGKLLRSPESMEGDVLFGSTGWPEEALENTRSDPAGFPVLDLPYPALMKIETSRTQDISDVSRMLGLAYEPDLESLIYLGKIEMGE